MRCVNCSAICKHKLCKKCATDSGALNLGSIGSFAKQICRLDLLKRNWVIYECITKSQLCDFILVKENFVIKCDVHFALGNVPEILFDVLALVNCDGTIEYVGPSAKII